MDETSGNQSHSNLSRRTFLGALGAAAATGALIQSSSQANAQSQSYYYQNSFGDIVPAGDGAIELG